ncbi:MAG: hypothetical protein RL885_24075 [Planctomycetota bacterium]
MSGIRRIDLLWLGLCLLAGCSSGSGSERPIVSAVQDNDLAGVVTDYDGDGNLDLLRVSTQTQPVTIVQAMFGDGRGRYLDNTANLTTRELSSAASQALLARLNKGRARARGLELLRVNDTGGTRLYFLIFG